MAPSAAARASAEVDSNCCSAAVRLATAVSDNPYESADALGWAVGGSAVVLPILRGVKPAQLRNRPQSHATDQPQTTTLGSVARHYDEEILRVRCYTSLRAIMDGWLRFSQHSSAFETHLDSSSSIFAARSADSVRRRSSSACGSH